VLMRRVAETGVTVAREGMEFGVQYRELAVGGQLLRLQGLKGVYHDVFLPLYGEHQASNAACALAAVETLAGTTGEPLDEDLVRQAFASVKSPGRLEVVKRGPTVLVDAAHNIAGMEASIRALTESFAFDRLIGVVAMMADKDVPAMLGALEPVLTEVVVTRNSSPRSMDVDRLAELAREVFGPERVHEVPRLDDAIDKAIALADQGGDLGGNGVLITGSVVTSGDARTLLRAADV
jgi:dihydrofolate synthase / folylpolyglutamate synthase